MTIRMNDALRERLNKLVETTVTFPDLDSAIDQLYRDAAPLVWKAVEAKYPQKDMKICAKYEAASVDDCIDLQLTAGGVNRFHFRKGTGPLVVKKTYHNQVYLADEDTTNAVLAWLDAVDKRNENVKAVQNDYRALIKSARTLEEIIEIWPQAEEVSQYARSQALTVLSEDVIARIKADAAKRK